MKKIILSAAAALLLAAPCRAGEITSGSVPGSLNYQGRLERDNAPITGPIHLYFRIYNSATASNTGGGLCGGSSQPCLWQSPEVTVQAAQGIFSADLTPPLSVLAGGHSLFLEVQVESDVLSPREPLNSVAFALVAKKLEDGADVLLSTLTATYSVSLATAAGAQMTVGTDSPDTGSRLTVDGSLKLMSGSIIFPDNTSMNSSGLGSAGSIANVSDADIMADSDGIGGGGIIFHKPAQNFMYISNSGLAGIGSGFSSIVLPKGRLDVDGEIYVGSEGIYPRDPGDVNIMSDLTVTGGKFTGMNGENISLGETNDVIAFNFGAVERMRIHSNNNVGIGLSLPTAPLHVLGDIRSNAGMRGGTVSIGSYTGWTALANEVRATDSAHLLLQQSNPYYVGIGTDTPREKLHVRGSVRSDYGITAATASFSGDVRVNGTLTANSGQGNTVNLSSTVIYGTLQVTGGIGSMAGVPVYLNSTQTLTGQNTFLNQVFVSSDIYTTNRLGAGVSGFDFSGSRYLQVGDDAGGVYANDNGLIYLVGGSNANAKLNFYRGAALASRLETQGGANLALVVNEQTKTLTDATYHRIQNSVVWVSTGYNTTPAIFVSSSLGNVGIGTSVMDPNWKLTVEGNIRLSGATSNALIFADGTTLNSAGSIGSATNLSANGDAIVQSNADYSGGGDVILRSGPLDGLIVNSGGNVGIGTMYPVSRLNVRGGDLVLGTPYNPYDGDSVPDLVVGGNIAFDGEMIQRSALPVQLSGLIVANDVYLSTASGKTGVGTRSPYTTFDVNGSAQFGSGVTKSTFTSAGVLQLASPLGVAYGGAGASLSAVVPGGILYKNSATTVGGSAALTGVLKGNGAGAPTAMNGTANYITYWSDANTIAAEQHTDVTRGGTGVGTLTGVVRGNGTADMTAMNGTASYNTYWSDANTIAAEQYTNVTRGGTGVGTLTGVVKGNGTGAMTAMTGTANYSTYWSDANTIAAEQHTDVTRGGTGVGTLTGVVRGNGTSDMSAMTGTLNRIIKWTPDGNTIGNSLISDDGTDVNMNSHKIINVSYPSANTDAATKLYVDDLTGTGVTSRGWSKSGNTLFGGEYLGSSNAMDLVFKTDGTTRATITAAGALQLNTALGLAYGGSGANLSATGGANQFVRQNSAGGVFTVSAIADADVPDSITISGTNNVSWASIDQTGSSLADLVTRSAGDLTSGTLAAARGGTGISGAGGTADRAMLTTNGTSWTTGKVTSDYTTGVVSDTFIVYSSTGATGTCRSLTITNGLLTNIGNVACPVP